MVSLFFGLERLNGTEEEDEEETGMEPVDLVNKS